MAIYHYSIKIISRGRGKSAVAAAAYRGGERITNEYDGIIHDYTLKRGVVHTEVLMPDHAPKKYAEGLYCKGRFLTSKYYIKAERAKAVCLQLSAQPHAQNNRHHHRERHRGREDIFSWAAFEKLQMAKPKSQAEKSQAKKSPTAKSKTLKTTTSKKEHFILRYDVFQHNEKIFSLFQKKSSDLPHLFSY